MIAIIALSALVQTIQEDLVKKRAHHMEAIILEINQCTKDYYDNQCDPDTRLGPIQNYCLEKEKCMYQDPSNEVLTTKMTAMLVAEILNDFVESLSFKTIGVVFLLVFGYLFLFVLILIFQ